MLDRVLRYAHIVQIKGDSYRLKKTSASPWLTFTLHLTNGGVSKRKSTSKMEGIPIVWPGASTVGSQTCVWLTIIHGGNYHPLGPRKKSCPHTDYALAAKRKAGRSEVDPVTTRHPGSSAYRFCQPRSYIFAPHDPHCR